MAKRIAWQKHRYSPVRYDTVQKERKKTTRVAFRETCLCKVPQRKTNVKEGGRSRRDGSSVSVRCSVVVWESCDGNFPQDVLVYVI